MRILRKLLGREDAAVTDARRIYAALMAQSRLPAFYGDTRFSDDYDGRIDVLTLHIAAILSNLNRFGENGERLGQALFDEMKDDFEIALREEALSDASVKKRIQPMISLFYDRVKKYAEALHKDDRRVALNVVLSESLSQSAQSFAETSAEYLEAFDKNLSDLSIGQIAMTEFQFPKIAV
jgi:cytochrome b pre-mRNA-processing protein 3